MIYQILKVTYGTSMHLRTKCAREGPYPGKGLADHIL